MARLTRYGEEAGAPNALERSAKTGMIWESILRTRDLRVDCVSEVSVGGKDKENVFLSICQLAASLQVAATFYHV